ncbi:CobW family GTP-binding protein [Treponema putidum]|uniref:GTP-binding protein n=1 Tax=Treponema putidum TaxID=221027 RepID=A0ABY5HXT8_9SPIR|nr:GTP-binding protein [Treponema putidum]UTY29613.1 GTP-binding protein [Treponema putidum]
MKILVISGFLGAGKTTFIQKLAEKSKKNFAVMENEYGITGIDGNILKQDRLKVWELTEGCICCSLQSDFASSILTIANTTDLDYLVVEPTGVGLLSAVIHNISKIEYERIRLLEPITIVDVHCVDNYLKEFGDLYTDQIKNAPHIILSKTENTSGNELNRIITILKELNPKAQITSEPYNAQKPEWWKKFFENLYNKNKAAQPLIPVNKHGLENVGFTGIKINSVNELLELLVALMQGFLGTVYRVKGYVSIGGQWTKFDVVNKQYNVSLCNKMPESKVIVIGRNLEKNRLKAAFNVKVK